MLGGFNPRLAIPFYGLRYTLPPVARPRPLVAPPLHTQQVIYTSPQVRQALQLLAHRHYGR